MKLLTLRLIVEWTVNCMRLVASATHSDAIFLGEIGGETVAAMKDV